MVVLKNLQLEIVDLFCGAVNFIIVIVAILNINVKNNDKIKILQ